MAQNDGTPKREDLPLETYRAVDRLSTTLIGTPGTDDKGAVGAIRANQTAISDHHTLFEKYKMDHQKDDEMKHGELHEKINKSNIGNLRIAIMILVTSGGTVGAGELIKFLSGGA